MVRRCLIRYECNQGCVSSGLPVESSEGIVSLFGSIQCGFYFEDTFYFRIVGLTEDWNTA